MEFIPSKSVCQKEVITFSRLWEVGTQGKTRLIIRKEMMGEIEHQSLTIQKEDPSSDEEYEGINS